MTRLARGTLFPVGDVRPADRAGAGERRLLRAAFARARGDLRARHVSAGARLGARQATDYSLPTLGRESLGDVVMV